MVATKRVILFLASFMAALNLLVSLHPESLSHSLRFVPYDTDSASQYLHPLDIYHCGNSKVQVYPPSQNIPILRNASRRRFSWPFFFRSSRRVCDSSEI